jgi:hypothetical protein
LPRSPQLQDQFCLSISLLSLSRAPAGSFFLALFNCCSFSRGHLDTQVCSFGLGGGDFFTAGAPGEHKRQIRPIRQMSCSARFEQRQLSIKVKDCASPPFTRVICQFPAAAFFFCVSICTRSRIKRRAAHVQKTSSVCVRALGSSGAPVHVNYTRMAQRHMRN